MIIDSAFSRELAGSLLDINAVLFRPERPFTWSSGWNSPIYCDNRLTMLYPDLRERIAGRLSSFLAENYSGIDVVTGTATAGIPHAAWVADRSRLPMAYVRAKAKAYGMGNQIEGGVRRGQSTVIIEDLVSTGTSVLSVIEALQFIGARVEGVLGLFTYGFDLAHQRFEEHGVPLYTLTDYSTLLSVALEKDYIKENDLETLQEWRKHPEKWPKTAL